MPSGFKYNCTAGCFWKRSDLTGSTNRSGYAFSGWWTKTGDGGMWISIGKIQIRQLPITEQ